jgi:hypothetical protein
MTTLTVPAEVLPRLRAGAQLQLENAAAVIQRDAGAWDKDDAPLEAREQMRRAWALIDVLGWAGDVPESIKLDAHEHADALCQAVADMLASITEVIAELPEDNPLRAERAEELQALREFEGAALRAVERGRQTRSLMVPAALLCRVREGVSDLANGVAEAIDHGANLRECARRLTVIADLLDALGEDTGAMVALDIEYAEQSRRNCRSCSGRSMKRTPGTPRGYPSAPTSCA